MKYLGREDVDEGLMLSEGLHWGVIETFSPNVPDEKYISVYLRSQTGEQMRFSPRLDEFVPQKRCLVMFVCWGIKLRTKFKAFWSE